MKDGPPIAAIASLIGDPARAAMLGALMTGKALTASELAREAGVTAPTASGHLGRLRDGGLILLTQQGRHRYYRLAGADVADLIESLMGVAARRGLARTRTGPRDAAMRRARVCYDHLAGEEALRLVDSLVRAGRLEAEDGAFRMTEAGRRFVCDFGIDLPALEAQRRPLCRACLDWSERRPHLGGGLGAALLTRFQNLGWMRREEGARALTVTPKGVLGLARLSRDGEASQAVG